MSARGAIVIASLAIAVIANIVSMQLIGLMTDAVNRDRDPKKYLWPWGWNVGPGRVLELVREYRATHPGGKLYRQLRITFIVMAVSFAIFYVTAGSFLLPSR